MRQPGLGRVLQASTAARGALGALAAMCLVILFSTAILARPVNDDFWALGALNADGFWGALVWYYQDFQGNVTSWFFILLHAQLWANGVGLLGASLSIAFGYIVLGGACWGVLTYFGVRLPTGWVRYAILTIATTITWLSLASFISPNSLTAVHYMISTFVHIWPWALALLAVGLLCRHHRSTLALVSLALLGFLAGSLGIVEAACLVGATAIFALWSFSGRASCDWWGRGAGVWTGALLAGFVFQLASPATWGRGSGLGSEGALTTNVQAVERLLNLSDRIVGPAVGQNMLIWADIEVWARVLVPLAVVGDVLLRPGVLAVFVVGALWAVGWPRMWQQAGVELNARIVPLLVILAGGAVVYSLSGALYAYAGRHVAGLALVGTALALGLGARTAAWWERRRRLLVTASVLSAVVLSGLGLQQVGWAWSRAQAWDAAQVANWQSIRDGRVSDVIEVPVRAGLSMSGLRDHGNSQDYRDWLMDWQRNSAPKPGS